MEFIGPQGITRKFGLRDSWFVDPQYVGWSYTISRPADISGGSKRETSSPAELGGKCQRLTKSSPHAGPPAGTEVARFTEVARLVPSGYIKLTCYIISCIFCGPYYHYYYHYCLCYIIAYSTSQLGAGALEDPAG